MTEREKDSKMDGKEFFDKLHKMLGYKNAVVVTKPRSHTAFIESVGPDGKRKYLMFGDRHELDSIYVLYANYESNDDIIRRLYNEFIFFLSTRWSVSYGSVVLKEYGHKINSIEEFLIGFDLNYGVD